MPEAFTVHITKPDGHTHWAWEVKSEVPVWGGTWKVDTVVVSGEAERINHAVESASVALALLISKPSISTDRKKDDR